jgi:hypothetical protein
MRQSCIFPAASILCLLLFTGCAQPTRPVSLPIWQESVERYIAEEASGDPNVLREMNWARDQKGFSIIGAPVPEKSTDANGLLLAHRQIAGRTRFVFLVGLVERREVGDIRLAVYTPGDQRQHWHMSPENPQSLQRYLEHRRNNWPILYPGLSEPPPGYLSFPRADDEFHLAVDGNRLTVTHQQSGATWMLALPPPVT